MVVHIGEGACGIVRFGQPDRVPQPRRGQAALDLARRRIDHVVRAVPFVDLGRPVVLRAEGLFGLGIGVAEFRPALEGVGGPAAEFAARAVHVILAGCLVVQHKGVADVRDLPVGADEIVRTVLPAVCNVNQFVHFPLRCRRGGLCCRSCRRSCPGSRRCGGCRCFGGCCRRGCLRRRFRRFGRRRRRPGRGGHACRVRVGRHLCGSGRHLCGGGRHLCGGGRRRCVRRRCGRLRIRCGLLPAAGQRERRRKQAERNDLPLFHAFVTV